MFYVKAGCGLHKCSSVIINGWWNFIPSLTNREQLLIWRSMYFCNLTKGIFKFTQIKTGPFFLQNIMGKSNHELGEPLHAHLLPLRKRGKKEMLVKQWTFKNLKLFVLGCVSLPWCGLLFHPSEKNKTHSNLDVSARHDCGFSISRLYWIMLLIGCRWPNVSLCADASEV